MKRLTSTPTFVTFVFAATAAITGCKKAPATDLPAAKAAPAPATPAPATAPAPAAAPTAAQLLETASNKALTDDQRAAAAKALGDMKNQDAGVKLVALGDQVASDGMMQENFYKAAGACGGDATFQALIASYEKATAASDLRAIPLRAGLRQFPTQVIEWSKDKLAKAKGLEATNAADLVADAATKEDLDAVLKLLSAQKDPMARDRLATAAIKLGATDVKLFEVYATNLNSKDEYDRSDAANFLSEVTDKVPAELKAKLVTATQAAVKKADSRDAANFNKVIKDLGGA